MRQLCVAQNPHRRKSGEAYGRRHAPRGPISQKIVSLLRGSFTSILAFPKFVYLTSSLTPIERLGAKFLPACRICRAGRICCAHVAHIPRIERYSPVATARHRLRGAGAEAAHLSLARLRLP